ncbi:MAG: hypothetical protein RLZZ387_1840 [Chloroflexota bacterium]|jgi:hypothetical protein
MLNDTQLATLQAALDRIIPPDDAPGAWEAGAGEYILLQLRGDLADMLGTYRAGLDSLDYEALAASGRPFAELGPDAQDALLARVERGEAQVPWTTDSQQFFHTLCEHAAEGFYSDPGNGGNRDGVAWRMIGFEVRG